MESDVEVARELLLEELLELLLGVVVVVDCALQRTRTLAFTVPAPRGMRRYKYLFSLALKVKSNRVFPPPPEEVVYKVFMSPAFTSESQAHAVHPLLGLSFV
jgi:hypothetical protein